MDLARPITSVVPGLPGRVLGVLGRSEVPLTGRAIAKAIDPPASQAGVANVLGAFVRDGIVLRVDAGRSATYVLNREHLAAPFIEGLAELRATFIERLSATFGDLRPAPLSVYLYGSAARGDGDADSDVDIALVVSDQMGDAVGWDAATAEVRRRVHAMTGNEISLVEYRLRDVFAEDHPIAATLRTEGIRLAGATIDDLARRWAAQDQRTRDSARRGRDLLAEEPAKALRPLTRALAAYRDLGDRYGEAAILDDLAEAYADLARWDESIAAATDAAMAFGDLGDRERQARATARVGGSHAAADRHKRAIAEWEQALALGDGASETWRGQVHMDLAYSLVEVDEMQRARAECERAVGLFDIAGATAAEAHALLSLAYMWCSADPDKAVDAARRASSLFDDLGDEIGVGRCLLAVGLAWSGGGQNDDAIAALNKALARLRTAGDDEGESLALWFSGEAMARAGRTDDSIALLRAAVERYRAAGHPRDEAVVLEDLGRVCATAGRHEDALDAYRQALDAFRRSGDSARTRSTLHLLERLHAERRTAS